MVVYARMPQYMLNELKLMHCNCLDNLKLMRLGVDIQKMKIDCHETKRIYMIVIEQSELCL
jgi:hypothetical protein